VAVSAGAVLRVNGPVVEVLAGEAVMGELVEVGDARLPGEVIAISGEVATVQVYEYTGGVAPGQPALATRRPLVAELGPGLIGGVFDGMLRRLNGGDDLLRPGAGRATLQSDARWHFTPTAKVGDAVSAGMVLGHVPETAGIEFRLLVPVGVSGTLEWIAPEGGAGALSAVARIAGSEVTLTQTWPVRRPRPVAERLPAVAPLVTGQRVLDLLFPIARGSSAAVPGGFGTGKTVLLQQIAKWCDADVIVYVGCGERGNEMADVLEEFAALTDPRTGQSLLDRTVLIANTSNMPVLAREASIHTGAAVAEYYRDMGHDVVIVADSTSRWAEALREVASRTGELPAEEGYPAGLASALAAFYERAGRVRTLAGSEGSITILGAVSPPGGDMTEPVSAHTRRFVRCAWSLDPDLAYARHYPAISWRDSSSRDVEAVAGRHAAEGAPDWPQRREQALRLLAEAGRLESMAELVGSASLPDRERLILRTARLLQDAVLQQSSLSENDTYCAPSKQEALLELVLGVHERCAGLLDRGVPFAALEQVDLSPIRRARDETPPAGADEVRAVGERVGGLLESIA
jgi:V/A-type H+/Na+-transporting ATPase subunit A